AGVIYLFRPQGRAIRNAPGRPLYAAGGRGRWLAAHGGLRPRRATRREITRQRYPLYQNRYAAVQQRRPWILGLGLVLRITVGRAPAFRRRLGIPEPTARAEPRHG